MAKIKELKYVYTNSLSTDILYEREDYGDIRQLRDSIIENGIITPLVVYEKKKEDDSVGYVIISGNRRYAAIKNIVDVELYNDFKVPVIVVPAPKTKEDEMNLFARIIIDNDRKPLTELEEAIMFYRLKYMGWTISEIAKRCGRSDSIVRDYLILFEADEEMRFFISEGKMTVANAIKALKKKGVTNED